MHVEYLFLALAVCASGIGSIAASLRYFGKLQLAA